MQFSLPIPVKRPVPAFLNIGHRGAAGHAPENTLYSIETALAQGARCIEIDVHRVENELVVIHDAKLERTTNGKGELVSSSLAYIRTLNAGQGERVPLLTEVLKQVGRRASINIELKGTGTAELVAELIERYVQEHHWLYEDFLVSSFDHHALIRIHQHYPSIRLGVLARKHPLMALKHADRIKAYSLHLKLPLVTAELVAEAHRRGLQVYVYTVNELRDIRRMLWLEVDGVFSDYPDRVSAALACWT